MNAAVYIMRFQDDRNREEKRGGPSLFAPRSYINAHIQTRQLLSVMYKVSYNYSD